MPLNIISMRLFFVVLFSIALQATAQEGYFSIGGTSLTSGGFNPGFTFGGGYINRNIGLGVVGDFYGIGKKNDDFAVASLDLRAYLSRSIVSPYISLQPGVVLYDKTLNGVHMKGNFAGAVVLGLDALFKEDKPGLNLFLGYQYTSFKFDKAYISRTNSFKSGITVFLN